ncbi:phosphoribosyl transferase domain protein [Thozetella sp. PMI_491]|nr:phosphoribosyl transferase domain protein [Thozetella sp. PMI_491]
MTTLDILKEALRESAATTAPSSPKQPLSDAQYSAGFDILVRGPGWSTYQSFIIPQLSRLLVPLFKSRLWISVLEIGPGPKTVLGYLPTHLRRKVGRYVAFEPNRMFASTLEEWLRSNLEMESPLPCLERPPEIHRTPFVLGGNKRSESDTDTSDGDKKFDVILFCHSMYGMKPQHKFIEQALGMLIEQADGGMVVVFHRDGALQLDGLVCHQTTSFPSGVVSLPDDDDTLDCFAPFVAGFVTQDMDADKAVRVEWRKACRAMGRREKTHPDRLSFSSPNVMVAFTPHATALTELMTQVPLVKGVKTVKNREACRHRPALVVRPTELWHVQQCVRWSLKHDVSLIVVGGGHSGHCLRPNVVSVDMAAFDQVHILAAGEDEGFSSALVVAEAGCRTEDIVRKAMAFGLTVPLGARPSVGAGLWLQGGIGHLSRLHGLACDAIVGAVMVSVESSRVLCIGHVPSQYRPTGAVRPENETDLLWALKGAGTNFGVVMSVTFRACAAPTYLTRNWVAPLSGNLEAQLKLSDFDNLVASKLPRDCSADAYLYWDTGRLHLGVTIIECSATRLAFDRPTMTPSAAAAFLGPEDSFKAVDAIGLFETEMYMSGMHGGHSGGKTSSFKRCVFLSRIGAVYVADMLVAAVENRPSSLCYLHLLHGGGAVGDVVVDATAFGCRDWAFACVITGVWPRDQDGSAAARAAVQWVYDVARNLLPVSTGAYGADLGPDPRDAELAAKAFGPNRSRLARLKRSLDPRNVLAYACPLPKLPMEQRLIILVTGQSCAGKDYCAEIWASMFMTCTEQKFRARVVSISDAIKREYAAATGAELTRLLHDRAYKEEHRLALTDFFRGQVHQRPGLPEDHFLNVVYDAADVDVLLITGMRDKAPVATLSHLVPDSRLLEIRVQASKETRQVRGGVLGDDKDGDDKGEDRSSIIFDNDVTGNEAAKRFAKHYLLPFLHEDLRRLANMVRPVSDFPRLGIEFRHVLNISQQPGGLKLCTSLLQSHFNGDWAKVAAVACCEAGGFVFASALASRVSIPLALIREAGKLPPPTVSVVGFPSHISSSASDDLREKRIEMNRDIVYKGASVVVVDDVLATGKTLWAVLCLLNEAGVASEYISVMVVAEFPFHRGRELLRRRGFGRVTIRSLLVFGGA